MCVCISVGMFLLCNLNCVYKFSWNLDEKQTSTNVRIYGYIYYYTRLMCVYGTAVIILDAHVNNIVQ